MLDSFEQQAEAILEEQITICEIAAPTGEEGARADYVQRQLSALGLIVRVDGIGNVIAHHSHHAGRPIVLSAHLDTVFGPDQDVSVARPGQANPYRTGEVVPGGQYHAPGISDAAAGLAAILAIARAVHASEAQRRIAYLATVGEEGRGDLRGARYFFETEYGRSAAAFITIDHSDPAAIVNRGIGSRRYDVEYVGRGGHSWGHFGRYNPAFALAGAMDRLAEIRTPSSPRTTYNVGVIRGGETVNAIPESARMEIDLRSESKRHLDELGCSVQDIIRSAHDRERRRRSDGARDPVVTRIGERPAGVTQPESMLVQAAMAALASESYEPRLIAASTDANAAMAAGVPAIAMSWGGASDNQHSVREWFDPTDRARSLRAITRTLVQLVDDDPGEPD